MIKTSILLLLVVIVSSGIFGVFAITYDPTTAQDTMKERLRELSIPELPPFIINGTNSTGYDPNR